MDQGDGSQVDWLDDLVDAVRDIHEIMLQIGGGAPGEDIASLYAACARPFHSAFGEDVYKTPFERAAAIFHGIICDHVFTDGNKRTGTVTVFYVLAAMDVLPDYDDQGHLRLALLGEVALETAQGLLTVHEVAGWMARIFTPQESVR